MIHILYISGLGDRYDPGRRFFLRFWQLFGVTAELVPMQWADGHSYDEKFARLAHSIDAVSGKRVVLIGESAGGSITLDMYASRGTSIYKAMTICGKNSHPEDVAPSLYLRNPAFKTAMSRVGKATHRLSKVQRQAFISIYPFADHVVPIHETLIPDCQHHRLWSFGHFASILLALTCASWYIVRLAKR